MSKLFKNYPLPAFFLLAFFFSWASWSLLIATTPPGKMMETGPSPAFLAIALLGGMGPSLAGMAMAGLLEGKAGLRGLLSGLTRPQGGLRWYLVSLFTVPLLSLAVLGLFYLLHHSLPLGDLRSRLGLGLTWPLFSSLGEELGWRGFALPRLQQRFKPAGSALAIGLLWGVWHLPADYLGIGNQGLLFILNFVILGPVMLTGFSVLMTWVYNRTKGDLLAMVLFHYSITFSAIVLTVPGLAGTEGVQFNLLSAAAVWVAAGWALVRMAKASQDRKEAGT
ncbi:MAG: CPBP family intramembrane glutamic endopeptidase [candidate division FCPU426 bacterium]